MAGIADVAAAAKVTVGVVSRVLNGDPTVRVRPETRERIHAAAIAVNYTPNHAARALRGAKMGAIAFAVHDVSNPVYAAIITGAQHAASREGFVVMLADVPELARDSAAFTRVVRTGIVDGLLLLPAGVPSDLEVANSAAAIVPTVIVNDATTTLSSVSLDDESAAHLATDHLRELGHTDIGLLTLDGANERASSRTLGWERSMSDGGLRIRREWMRNGGHTVETGRAAMAALLQQADLPTAILASSVLSAVGAMAAIRESGRSVPDDISVIGFHDVFFADTLTPSLSVVELPLAKLGEQSALMLLRLIGGGENEHIVVTDPGPRIIARQSTATPRRPS